MSTRPDWFAVRPDIRVHPGAAVTALEPFEGHQDLFATGSDGAVWSTYFKADGGWRPWFPIHPETKMQPGTTVIALQTTDTDPIHPANGHVDLFATGNDGAVWSTFFNPQGEWVPWFTIHSELKMHAGATVTALEAFEGHIDLFATGSDGTVWSTFFEADGGWRPWRTVHVEVKMQPGATVTALQPFEGHVDLFVTGTDGAVWSTFFEDDGGDWRPWFPIHSEVKMKPGAAVTALQPFEGHVDLFVTGIDGTVWSTFFENDGDGWRPWFTIHSEVKMQRGATVTALQPFEGHVDLFVTGTDGAVWSTFFENDGDGWRPWFAVHSEIRMRPGATVTAMRPFEGHVDLYATGVDGAVWSTFFEDGGGWRDWMTLTNEPRMQPGATVTTLDAFDGHVDLFVTGTDGTVWSTFNEGHSDWARWFAIHAEVKMQPGATVTALQPFEGHVDLFVTGTDGAVWSTFFESDGGGWRPWFTIHAEKKMKPGAAVTALQSFGGHIDLFVIGIDGVVSWSFFESDGGWRPWFVIDPFDRMIPGATVTALQPFEGHVDLFVTGADGTVWSTFFENDGGGWRPWFTIHSEQKMQPGTAVTALQSLEGHVDLYATGADGTAWTTYFEVDGGWRKWTTLSRAASLVPGATVSALLAFEDHVGLFVTGIEGTVWAAFLPRGRGWLTWFTIHAETRMMPGAVVTAIQPFEGHVDLFATAQSGVVWSTFFEAGGGWRDWFPLSANNPMHPGVTVTALQPFEGHVDLFVTAADGAVWSTFFEDGGGGWRPWFPIHDEVKMHPGATVTALQPFEGHVDLFVTGTDGAVWSTFFEDGGGWRPWFPIHSEVKMKPGAAVTVLHPTEGHVDLFVTGGDGTVWSTFFEGDGGEWRPWSPVHAEVKMDPGATVAATGDSFTVSLYAVDSHGTMWTTFRARGEDWRPWTTIRPEVSMRSGAMPTRAGAKVYAVGGDGAVWSGTSFNAPFGSPNELRERLQWHAWEEINTGYPVDPRGAATVQILGERSDDGFAEHTNVYATGTDGAVWSTFWRTQDESRIFRPNIPFWSPGENGYNGGVGLGPGGGYDE